MRWSVTFRIVLLLSLPCVYFQSTACGGTTATVTSSNSDSDGSNDNSNDNNSDGASDNAINFDEDAQFKSFAILTATLQTFESMEAQYLISNPAPAFLYATESDCEISGETIADSSLLDFNSCVVDIMDFRLLLSGDVTVTSPDSLTDIFTYQLGVEVFDDSVDYVFGIEGNVTKTETDAGDEFEFDIDTTLEDEIFGINGTLTLENDLYTGSLSLLYTTLLASCSFNDFTVSDFETFASFCEF